MNTYYTELFALTILAILFHFAVIIKRYTEKILVPYFFNAKVDWNPNIDRIKLLFSSFFLLSPILLTRSFIKFNSSTFDKLIELKFNSLTSKCDPEGDHFKVFRYYTNSVEILSSAKYADPFFIHCFI